MSLRHKLSRLHEADVHALLGGHSSKSSGNQWHDAADGKHGAYDEFALGWDCKCALPGTERISISREDLDKITEQARGRIPGMPLRWYSSERGQVEHDFILVPLSHYNELRERASE